LCLAKKIINEFGNDKPRNTKDLKFKLKDKEEAFKKADETLHVMVKYNIHTITAPFGNHTTFGDSKTCLIVRDAGLSNDRTF